MAFPFVFQSDFEGGTNGEWDSETDTASQLDIASFKELSRFPWPTCAPFRGAYCARWQLTGGTDDAYLVEGDINIADTATRWFRWYVWFSPDFDATANDTVALFEVLGVASAVTGSVGFRYVAATDVINIGIGAAASGAAPTAFSAVNIEKGQWYCVEAAFDVQTGGTGTANLYITKENTHPSATADATVSTVTNIAVTDGWFGVQDQLATTTGTILMDQFCMDDARIYPYKHRFPQEVLLTKSGHVFVGQGKIRDVELLSGAGTDNVLSIYDADDANTNDATNIVEELKNTANNQRVASNHEQEFSVHHGAYVTLTGTNPRALVTICHAPGYSVSGMRHYGQFPD